MWKIMRANMWNKVFFFSLLSLLSLPKTIKAQGKLTCGTKAYIILYSEPDCRGESLENEFAQDLVDLKRKQFDNKAHSVCTIGMFLLFENDRYNEDMGGGVEVVTGLCEQESNCRNLTTVAGKASSLRLAGHPNDWRYNTLFIFPGPDFSGFLLLSMLPPQTELDEIPSALKSRRSIIMTGNTSFTVFSETFFKGDAICVKAEDNSKFQPYFLKDASSLFPNVYWGKSIRIGCEGKVVTLKGKKQGSIYVVEKEGVLSTQ